MVAPQGRITIANSAVVVRDSGQPDPVDRSAQQHSIEDLPEEALVFLLGSRYCDTEKLSQIAWEMFGQTPPGWARVQAICDFVHNHITFDYEHARATRTASEAFNERRGVCRDFTHLAIALLPFDEHSGALLHRLSRRHRHAAALRPPATSPPGSRPISAGAGICSTRATTCRGSGAY